MKQLAVVAVIGMLVLCSATAGHAQGVALGAVGGINIATLSTDEEGMDLDSRIALRAGAHLSVDFSPQFGLIIEAIYSQKGTTTTEEGVDVGINISYVEFPLLAKFMIPTSPTGNVTVHLAAGPAVGFEVSCKATGEEGGVS
ncbi:MAG: PorT family protein, partial [Gemmatimonadota bacterium]